MEMLYVLSAGTVLTIAALVIVFLLYRTIALLERIAAALGRMDTRDKSP
jgi:hypothetical protein